MYLRHGFWRCILNVRADADSDHQSRDPEQRLGVFVLRIRSTAPQWYDGKETICSMSKSILHLDLHPIAHNGAAIDRALADTLYEATRKRVRTIEIIPGKGSGQLMKRVKKWLDQSEIKTQYKRVQVDSTNHGRLFVHLR